MNIRDKIKEIAKVDVLNSLVCEITAVDKDARTVDVKPVIDEVPIEGVRYTVTEDDAKGVIFNPKKGSYCIVSWLDEDTAFVSLLTELETFNISNDQTDLKTIFLDLLAALKALTVTTGVGPSGIPINVQQFIQVEQKINQLFE